MNLIYFVETVSVKLHENNIFLNWKELSSFTVVCCFVCLGFVFTAAFCHNSQLPNVNDIQVYVWCMCDVHLELYSFVKALHSDEVLAALSNVSNRDSMYMTFSPKERQNSGKTSRGKF